MPARFYVVPSVYIAPADRVVGVRYVDSLPVHPTIGYVVIDQKSPTDDGVVASFDIDDTHDDGATLALALDYARRYNAS
jgi:hypothetical protein